MATAQITATPLEEYGVAQESESGFNWVESPDSLAIGMDGGVEFKRFYFQIKPGLDSGTTITRATLRLTPAATDSKLATYRLSRQVWSGDLSSLDGSHAVDGDVEPLSSQGIISGTEQSLDITAFVLRELLQSGDDAETIYTLMIEDVSSNPVRVYESGVSDPSQSPQIVFEYEFDDTPERDPLTKAYDWLADVIRNDPNVSSLVKPGNLIFYNENDRDPAKREVADNDLPEVRLDPADGDVDFYIDSHNSTFTERYNVEISTGDRRLAKRCNPVRFAIYRALSKWADESKVMTWNGAQIALDVSVVGVQNGEADEDKRRNVDGWASRITVQIKIVIPRSYLQA